MPGKRSTPISSIPCSCSAPDAATWPGVGLRAEVRRLPRRGHQERRQRPTSALGRQGLRRPLSVHRSALVAMPDETVIDGEIVALDSSGLRCHRLRLLREREADVRRPHSERVHSCIARETVQGFQGLEAERCACANLPELKAGRRGVGLTAEKMKDCR